MAGLEKEVARILQGRGYIVVGEHQTKQVANPEEIDELVAQIDKYFPTKA